MLSRHYLFHCRHFKSALQKRVSIPSNFNPTTRLFHNSPSLSSQLQTDKPLERLLSYKIRKNTIANDALFEEFNFQDSNIETSDLELSLSGSEAPIVTNLTWLRDSCHCKQCTHEYSRQRLFTVKDFQLSLFSISEIQLMTGSNGRNWIHSRMQAKNQSQNEDDCLSIRWSDGHQSLYSIAWLRHVCGLHPFSQLEFKDRIANYRLPQDDLYCSSESKTVRPIHWNVAEIKNRLKPVDYNELTDGLGHYSNLESTFINENKVEDMSRRRFEAMLNLTQQLVTYGLAKIYNVPQKRDQVLKVARSLAYERPTGYGTVFNVVVEPSEDINLAYTALEFDLHTDLPYRIPSPGVQLLHCIQNSMEGGSSYFSDAFNAAHLLRETDPKLFEVLVQFPVTFMVRDPYRSVNLRHQLPVISLDYEGNLSDIYYSPFMLPPIGHHQDLKLFYLAMDKLTKLMQAKENKMIVKMEPGELFIFHNRRVLHGRSAYDASKSSRWLQGCYMDFDELRCLHEKLFIYRSGSGELPNE